MDLRATTGKHPPPTPRNNGEDHHRAAQPRPAPHPPTGFNNRPSKHCGPDSNGTMAQGTATYPASKRPVTSASTPTAPRHCQTATPTALRRPIPRDPRTPPMQLPITGTPSDRSGASTLVRARRPASARASPALGARSAPTHSRPPTAALTTSGTATATGWEWTPQAAPATQHERATTERATTEPAARWSHHRSTAATPQRRSTKRTRRGGSPQDHRDCLTHRSAYTRARPMAAQGPQQLRNHRNRPAHRRRTAPHPSHPASKGSQTTAPYALPLPTTREQPPVAQPAANTPPTPPQEPPPQTTHHEPPTTDTDPRRLTPANEQPHRTQ